MKTLILRRLRWTWDRRLLLLLSLTLLIVLGAHPGAHAADVFNNISPAPQLPAGGWVGRYPVGNYGLDEYFPAISVGFTSGVDTSGLGPAIAYFGAQTLWEIIAFLANGVILLFAFAFNLDLVNGNGSPASGALAPVSQAIHNLYTSTFGAPWLIAVVTLVGCWAMWKALVQRRYTETAGALAVSLLYFVLAIGIVTAPERTISPASKLSNQLSTALLSLTSEGSVGSESQAKTAASNQLFELLVLNPWSVLEFGGVEHCATVNHGKPRSVAVRPLSPDPGNDTKLATQLEHGTEITANGKTCINNRNKYAAHFLPYPPGSKERGEEHEALEHGDSEDLPDSDPGKTDGTFPLGPADEPAAEAMGKAGQYQRLLLALVILLGEVGSYLLLGALAVGVILAQILLLTLLAFAPVALLIGIFPGRGHEFFRAWLGKLASYLARKVIYSLILAIVLAVCSALDDATSNLGWLLAFALQAAFLWTVFLQRNRLANDLLAGTVGPRAEKDGTNRLANLYFATRLARMMPVPHLPRRSGGQEPPAPSTGSPSSPGRGGATEGGAPPPNTSTPSGGGSPTPSGSAPSGEEHTPPGSAPTSNETPTHIPGAPNPGASPTTDARKSSPTIEPAAPYAPAATVTATPIDNTAASQGRPPDPGGEQSADQELLSAADAKTIPDTATPVTGVSSPEQPVDSAQRLLPLQVAPTSSPPSTSPPAVLPTLAAPAPAAAPVPGEAPPSVSSRTPSYGESLGEDELSPPHQQPTAVDPPPDAEQLRSAAPANRPTGEPVALLLRARHGAATADPATQEENPNELAHRKRKPTRSPGRAAGQLGTDVLSTTTARPFRSLLARGS